MSCNNCDIYKCDNCRYETDYNEAKESDGECACGGIFVCKVEPATLPKRTTFG